ncbi:MAG: Asp-tRNA(Asn)/Glu-tRNA(Gln) amidotransferase subunit GatC [Planctomycetota bacterium]
MIPPAPPTVTPDDVRRVARLARLSLNEQQVEAFADQLGAVLAYFGQLDGMDVAGVEPLFHPSDHHSVTRPDEPGEPLDPSAALANAPQRQDGFFRVPKVLDGGGNA